MLSKTDEIKVNLPPLDRWFLFHSSNLFAPLLMTGSQKENWHGFPPIGSLDNSWAKIQPHILFPLLTYFPFPYPIYTHHCTFRQINLHSQNMPKKVHYLHRLANVLSSPLTKKMVSSPNCKWERLTFSLPISILFTNPASSALYNNLLSTQVQVLIVSFAFNSEVMICIQIK